MTNPVSGSKQTHVQVALSSSSNMNNNNNVLANNANNDVNHDINHDIEYPYVRPVMLTLCRKFKAFEFPEEAVSIWTCFTEHSTGIPVRSSMECQEWLYQIVQRYYNIDSRIFDGTAVDNIILFAALSIVQAYEHFRIDNQQDILGSHCTRQLTLVLLAESPQAGRPIYYWILEAFEDFVNLNKADRNATIRFAQRINGYHDFQGLSSCEARCTPREDEAQLTTSANGH